MSTTEEEFLWKLTEILGQCEELKEMIPDEWPEEAQEQARTKMCTVMNLLRVPHSGLSLLRYSPEDGSSLTLHISKDPPELDATDKRNE